MSRPGPVPVTIAVCNRKGGAGKTTTSVNLAAELAARGLKVLLVDLDSQGHCALGLGVDAAACASWSHTLLRDEAAQLAPAIRATAVANLWLAPADQRFEHGSGTRDQLRLRRALASPEIAAFDVVLVDTPPSLDELLLGALCAADWVLVPYVPHPLSFEGIRQLMRALLRVKTGANPGLKVLGFVPVTAAAHVRTHQATNGAVGTQFGAGRVLPGIRSDIKLAEAFAAGQPARVFAPSSRGAADYAALADAVAALLGLGRPAVDRMSGPMTA